MKRKQSDSALDDDQLPVSTPKRQRTTGPNGYTNGEPHYGNGERTPQMMSPSKRVKSTPKKSTAATTTPGTLNPSGLKTPTHKSKAKSLFSTPTKSALVSTPGRVRNADRSAKRKSVRLLLDQDEDEVWDGADRLAEEILEEEEEDDQAAVGKQQRGSVEVKEIDLNRTSTDQSEEPVLETIEAQTEPGLVKTAETPKRRAGRPKGAKNKRSPTPEGELPPHERYFFQNRAGPPRTSNNTLSKVTLLTHEEYFEKLAAYTDPFQAEKKFLLDVHHRSFPQWDFEFAEGFNICLFGYGCKRRLVTQYADWIYQKYNNSTKTSSFSPTIIVVNGHTPNLSIRSIFATIATAILGEDLPSKLGSQPAEVLELLQSAMKTAPPRRRPITILINSIDAPSLRRAANQALLARLAATPMVRLLATTDTPNFTLMWDISQRDQFNFVFHDCTTFASYDSDVLDVVEEVHNLLGRKGRRVGGKDGVGFVLKSLPENARNLYRLLLTELLSALDTGHVSDEEMDGGGGGTGGGSGAGGMAHEESGIEFRMLYQKAAEEFIASSEMMFRTLLKEFHDHQMITSRMDSSGMEILGVPLSRVEMEGVLEDLVLN